MRCVIILCKLIYRYKWFNNKYSKAKTIKTITVLKRLCVLHVIVTKVESLKSNHNQCREGEHHVAYLVLYSSSSKDDNTKHFIK